jgi:hypothetical protein
MVEVKKKKREVHRHVRINIIYISIQKKDMRSHRLMVFSSVFIQLVAILSSQLTRIRIITTARVDGFLYAEKNSSLIGFIFDSTLLPPTELPNVDATFSVRAEDDM